MKRRSSVWIMLIVWLAGVAAAAPAFAQGGATSTIAGTVVDTSGASVPGASIDAKNVATGTGFQAVSGADGGFVIPAVPTGTYELTITLTGFKTTVLKDVVASVAQTVSVKAVLSLGSLEETITVTGASEIVQTQATSVATTLSKAQIASLPVVGRGAFELVGFMPGVSTTTGSLRDGTVNGLPQSAVNIQDNYAKSWDGMFTRVSPRLDAVEEVTISTAAQGADMGSQGAAQVRFVTRSGTNRFQGSAYYYSRRDWMNTNTWFNLNRNVDPVTGAPTPKARLFQDQPGGRLGGPIIRDKAFFFINYEWISAPGTRTDTRTIMSPSASQGLFQYAGGTIDLLALAARNGHVARIDPVVGKLLSDIRSATSQGTVTTTIDPLTQSFAWQQSTESTTTYPTVRLDYNVTSKHALTASGTYNHLVSNPDTGNSYQPIFPGFPVRGKQDSERYTMQLSLRSTLTPNMVNEFRLGATGGATLFAPDLSSEMFGQSVGNMGGYAIAWTNFKSISNAYSISTNSSREGSTRVAENTLNWLRGKHSLSIGGSVTRGDVWLRNKRHVPLVTLGMATGDPADAMFTPANFPGASATDITNARNLYAVLTGRVSSIQYDARIGGSVTRGDVWLRNKRHVPLVTLGMATGDPADAMFNATNLPGASATDITNARNLYAVLTGRVSSIQYDARIGEDGENYNILGESLQQGRMWQLGFFLQDGWRWKPNLTVNAGLRYEVQLPFYALNNSYSAASIEDIFGPTGTGKLTVGSTVNGLGNLYQPGLLQGAPTTYEMLTKDTSAYNTDYNNFAPSIGVAWTTGADGGWLRRVFGAPGQTVVRGGFNLSYQRGGMSDMTEVYGDNPGILIDATRNLANGNLGALPVLLTGSNLGPPNIPLQRIYPMAVPSRSSNVRAFDPNLRLPFAMSGTLGIQRAFGKHTSAEVRFIHTTSYDNWTLRNLAGALNYNEINIVENKFANEFRLAQANLLANIAAGRGSTFAYTGAPGTVPLPIYLANINGTAAATDPANYTGTNWTNTTLVQALYTLNPNPQSAAATLANNTTFFDNMVRAGLPVNFWRVNPYITNGTVVTNGGDTRYNAVQLILNRRYAGGFQVQANYTYGKGYQDDFYNFRVPYKERLQTYSNGSSSLGNVNHNFALNWLFDLPFGQGKRFASNANGLLNRIIGDWSIMGTLRFQSGRMIDYGNVRLVGMSPEEFSKMHTLRKSQDPNNKFRTLVWMLPDDVINSTIQAFSISATGYTAGTPSGKYMAPANGPDCLETSLWPTAGVNSGQYGYGACGTGSLVASGPSVFRTDMTIGKRIRTLGPINAEFQLMIFNVFSKVNFNPVGGTFAYSYVGTTKDSYQVTTAVDSSRTMQAAFRVSW